MSPTSARIFSNTRNFSSTAVAVVILVSVIFSQWIKDSSITWQVIVALIALAIGIPHGALDHLVTLPRASVQKMSVFILAYVTVAILAVIAILSWNVYGFIGVVIMSALHFGIGDTAFINELNRAANENSLPRYGQFAYAISAGALPVVVPLTNAQSTPALAAVNDRLINWHNGYDNEIVALVMVTFVVTVLLLAIAQRWRE